VTDGTSNTFAIGERTSFGADLSNDARWPSWCGPGGGGAMNTVSSAVADKVNFTGQAAFSSQHPGGAVFCFVDGSARFIAETVQSNAPSLPNGTGNSGDPAEFLAAAAQGLVGTYQLLGVINDGRPIGEQF
jgi:prepilin-type processing-associated H-X9-DG protein